jgi:glucosamine kinase
MVPLAKTCDSVARATIRRTDLHCTKVDQQAAGGNTLKKVFLIMAIWKHIIADSGGSTTTWAFCGTDGKVTYLETPGMHPKVVLSWQLADWNALRETLGSLTGETLFFYGAGCAQQATQEQLAVLLRPAGFETVSVFPDTLGACRATCKTQAGVVAILGTGSILVEYDGKAIVNRIGGYGSMIGDEGSGFHFGRLVLRDYLNASSDMPQELRGIIREIVGESSDVLRELASPGAGQWIAQLGSRFSQLELESYHRNNLEAFLAIYLDQLKNPSQTVNVVGSYGHYQQKILHDLLAERGWKSGTVLRNPIEQLVEFHR